MVNMDNLRIYLYEFFYVLAGAIAIFVLLEIVWPGVVLAYVNINWVLILWLIDGIFILLANRLK